MNDKARKALEAFVSTINNNGGLVRHADQTYGVAVDPDWIDLADSYLAACDALGLEPFVSVQAYDATL